MRITLTPFVRPSARVATLLLHPFSLHKPPPPPRELIGYVAGVRYCQCAPLIHFAADRHVKTAFQTNISILSCLTVTACESASLSRSAADLLFAGLKQARIQFLNALINLNDFHIAFNDSPCKIVPEGKVFFFFQGVVINSMGIVAISHLSFFSVIFFLNMQNSCMRM